MLEPNEGTHSLTWMDEFLLVVSPNVDPTFIRTHQEMIGEMKTKEK